MNNPGEQTIYRAKNMFSLKTLIWIDGIAALLSGCFVLALRGQLAPFFNLPEQLLLTMCCVSFGYAVYSIRLAMQEPKPQKLLKALVAANSIWAILCIVIAVYFIATATPWGIAYLILESLFVAALAVLEWRQIKMSSATSAAS